MFTAPRDGVTAMIQVVQALGSSIVVTAAWDDGALTARVPGITTLLPGETLGLRLGALSDGTTAAESAKGLKVLKLSKVLKL